MVTTYMGGTCVWEPHTSQQVGFVTYPPTCLPAHCLHMTCQEAEAHSHCPSPVNSSGCLAGPTSVREHHASQQVKVVAARAVRHVQGPPRDGAGRGMQQPCRVLGLEHIPVRLHQRTRVSASFIMLPGAWQLHAPSLTLGLTPNPNP